MCALSIRRWQLSPRLPLAHPAHTGGLLRQLRMRMRVRGWC